MFPIKIDPADKVTVETKIDTDRASYCMYGSAVRYYAEPVIPDLKTVNRVRVQKVGVPYTETFHIKNLNGVDVYGARWEIWYEPLSSDSAKDNGPLIDSPAASDLPASAPTVSFPDQVDAD